MSPTSRDVIRLGILGRGGGYVNTNRVCSRSVNSGGSTLEILEFSCRFIILTMETFEMVREEGRFRRSFGLLVRNSGHMPCEVMRMKFVLTICLCTSANGKSCNLLTEAFNALAL